MRRFGIALATTAMAMGLSGMPATAAAPKAGGPCTRAQVQRVIKANGVRLQCTKVGTRYIWRRVATAGVKAISPSSITRLQPYRQGGCSAFAPEGWALLVGAQSAGADLVNASRTLTASWGIIVVPAVTPGFGAMPPYNDPASYSNDPDTALWAHLRYYESADNPAGDLAITAQPPETFGRYRAITLRSSRNTVLALYTTLPGDGVSSRYVLVVRLAKAPNSLWPERAGLLANLALSIACTVQLQVPAPPDPATRKPAAKEREEGYNPWLGTEYVHNPATGSNYLVTQEQWSSSGPQGPGYYLGNGNDVTKLSAGRTPGS